MYNTRSYKRNHHPDDNTVFLHREGLDIKTGQEPMDVRWEWWLPVHYTELGGALMMGNIATALLTI